MVTSFVNLEKNEFYCFEMLLQRRSDLGSVQLHECYKLKEPASKEFIENNHPNAWTGTKWLMIYTVRRKRTEAVSIVFLFY